MNANTSTAAALAESRSRKPKRQSKASGSVVSMRGKLEKQLQEKLEKETQELKDQEKAPATRREEHDLEKERKKNLALKGITEVFATKHHATFSF